MGAAVSSEADDLPEKIPQIQVSQAPAVAANEETPAEPRGTSSQQIHRRLSGSMKAHWFGKQVFAHDGHLKPKSGKSSKRRQLHVPLSWARRQLSNRLFAVVRHAERADVLGSLVNGHSWTMLEESKQYPIDPPLSDVGQTEATRVASQLKDFSERSGSQLHVVVCSFYLRCVQTAIEVCKKLGPSTKLMLDHSLGEVFGHCVLGDIKPTSTWRSFSYLARYARSHGVRIVKKACGSVPAWPETLRTARQRYAGAFLSYLRRAEVSKRNFVLVSHADCIASILALIPGKAGRMVESVSYGATVLGSLPMDPRGTSSPAEQQEETLDPKESRPSKGAWQVELDRVRMGPRWRGGDAASSTAKRAMKSYCYNKLDVCMLQELLGGLSEEPLGDVSPKGVKPAVEQPEAESSWDQPNEIGDDVSCCSSSTFLFGDSETGSEFESSPISPISPGAAKAHSFCVADSQPYSPSFERLVSRGSQEAAKGGATRLRFGTTGSISDDGSPSRGSASRSSSVGRVKLQGRDGSAIMARRLKMTG